MSIQEFFDCVVQGAPSFDTARRSHVECFKELIPHVLMYDLVLFLESHFSGVQLSGAEPPTEAELREVFHVLDRGLDQGDEPTQNAIAVSFVESIGDEQEFRELRPLFGPALRDELDRQRQWRLRNQ